MILTRAVTERTLVAQTIHRARYGTLGKVSLFLTTISGLGFSKLEMVGQAFRSGHGAQHQTSVMADLILPVGYPPNAIYTC